VTAVSWFCEGRAVEGERRCTGPRHTRTVAASMTDLRPRVFRKRRPCWRCGGAVVVSMFSFV
jgi:hypothetical protein